MITIQLPIGSNIGWSGLCFLQHFRVLKVVLELSAFFGINGLGSCFLLSRQRSRGRARPTSCQRVVGGMTQSDRRWDWGGTDAGAIEDCFSLPPAWMILLTTPLCNQFSGGITITLYWVAAYGM